MKSILFLLYAYDHIMSDYRASDTLELLILQTNCGLFFLNILGVQYFCGYTFFREANLR